MLFLSTGGAMVRNRNAFTGNNGGNSACQKIKEVWVFLTCKDLTLQYWLNRFGGSWPNLNLYVLVCFDPSTTGWKLVEC